jgi:prepilin peptidase CpaA
VTLWAIPPLAILAAAALCDARWRIIPDALPLALAAGGAAAALASGWPAGLWAALAALAVFAGGAALFALGAMGGGDVKLAAALTLWLPAGDVPAFLILTSLAGGALALAMAAWRLAAGLAQGARPGAAWSAALAEPAPYGVAIAAGGAAAIAASGG